MGFTRHTIRLLDLSSKEAATSSMRTKLVFFLFFIYALVFILCFFEIRLKHQHFAARTLSRYTYDITYLLAGLLLVGPVSSASLVAYLLVIYFSH